HMQVVVLAGGYGTRLRPLTNKVPKPMVHIKGKPFLEHQIELLKKHGLVNTVLCIGYLGNVIETYFGDGGKFGVNISYSRNNQDLGTGGALKNSEHLLESEFLVVYGDSFLDMDYPGFASGFKKSGLLGMVAAYVNQPKIAPNNLHVVEGGQVVGYNKKEEGEANYLEAGVSAFKKEILKFIPAGTSFSLEEQVFPLLAREQQLAAFITSQKFYDIGTFERLKHFEQTRPA